MQNNVSIRSGNFGEGTDNFVTDDDPGFVNAAGMNFQFKSNAVVWTKIPNFQRIPFEPIGLYTDEYRKTLPKRERLSENRK